MTAAALTGLTSPDPLRSAGPHGAERPDETRRNAAAGADFAILVDRALHPPASEGSATAATAGADLAEVTPREPAEVGALPLVLPWDGALHRPPRPSADAGGSASTDPADRHPPVQSGTNPAINPVMAEGGEPSAVPAEPPGPARRTSWLQAGTSPNAEVVGAGAPGPQPARAEGEGPVAPPTRRAQGEDPAAVARGRTPASLAELALHIQEAEDQARRPGDAGRDLLSRTWPAPGDPALGPGSPSRAGPAVTTAHPFPAATALPGGSDAYPAKTGMERGGMMHAARVKPLPEPEVQARGEPVLRPVPGVAPGTAGEPAPEPPGPRGAASPTHALAGEPSRSEPVRAVALPTAAGGLPADASGEGPARLTRPKLAETGLPAEPGRGAVGGPTRSDSRAPFGRAWGPDSMDVAPGRLSGAELAPPDPSAPAETLSGPLAPGLWDGARPSPSHEPMAAREIARQVASQPVLQSGGGAELRLAPEELGQLRLSVESAEGGLRVTIEATRPETADLLRRHVETLRQELRQEGLGAVSVSIGGGETGRGTGHGSGRGDGAPPDLGSSGPAAGAGGPHPFPASAPSRSRPSPGQLDLRF